MKKPPTLAEARIERARKFCAANPAYARRRCKELDHALRQLKAACDNYHEQMVAAYPTDRAVGDQWFDLLRALSVEQSLAFREWDLLETILNPKT